MTVLVVSAHPDDEIAGVPGLVLGLLQQSVDVQHLVCSLGSDRSARATRQDELRRCSDDLRLDTTVLPQEPDPEPVEHWRLRVQQHVAGLLKRNLSLIVAPSPTDRHYAHEAVGRAVLAAIEEAGWGGVVCLWALWGYVAEPNALVTYDDALMHAAQAALLHYESQLARLELGEIIRARADLGRMLGPERVGLDAASSDIGRFVDEVHLRRRIASRWTSAAPARLAARTSLKDLTRIAWTAPDAS